MEVSRNKKHPPASLTHDVLSRGNIRIVIPDSSPTPLTDTAVSPRFLRNPMYKEKLSSMSLLTAKTTRSSKEAYSMPSKRIEPVRKQAFRLPVGTSKVNIALEG